MWNKSFTHFLQFDASKLLWKWFAFSLLRTLSSWEPWKLLTPPVKSLSFQSMPSWLHACLVSCQLFTSVFGVGPKTAEKWYRRGLRSFSDVLADRSIHLNRMQQNGTSTAPSLPRHSQIRDFNSSLLPRKTFKKILQGAASHFGFLLVPLEASYVKLSVMCFP